MSKGNDETNRSRYSRSGSKNHIMNILRDNGIKYCNFNVVEHWNGFGSFLIVIDADSEQEYYDIINILKTNEISGIKYHYYRVRDNICLRLVMGLPVYEWKEINIYNKIL